MQVEGCVTGFVSQSLYWKSPIVTEMPSSGLVSPLLVIARVTLISPGSFPCTRFLDHPIDATSMVVASPSTLSPHFIPPAPISTHPHSPLTCPPMMSILFPLHCEIHATIKGTKWQATEWGKIFLLASHLTDD